MTWEHLLIDEIDLGESDYQHHEILWDSEMHLLVQRIKVSSSTSPKTTQIYTEIKDRTQATLKAADLYYARHQNLGALTEEELSLAVDIVYEWMDGSEDLPGYPTAESLLAKISKIPPRENLSNPQRITGDSNLTIHYSKLELKAISDALESLLFDLEEAGTDSNLAPNHPLVTAFRKTNAYLHENGEEHD